MAKIRRSGSALRWGGGRGTRRGGACTVGGGRNGCGRDSGVSTGWERDADGQARDLPHPERPVVTLHDIREMRGVRRGNVIADVPVGLRKREVSETRGRCAARRRLGSKLRLNVLATYVERVRVRVPHRVPVHGPLCVCVPATRNQLADQWVGGASARMTHGVRDHDGVLRDQVPLVREVLGAEVRRGEPERVVEPRNLLPRRLAEVRDGQMPGCRICNSTACSAERTLAMARRYGRFFSSSSFGRRSRPQTRSISAWAFSWMSGQPAMWAANHCWIDAVCVGENEWLC